jgi:hypothetical protein
MRSETPIHRLLDFHRRTTGLAKGAAGVVDAAFGFLTTDVFDLPYKHKVIPAPQALLDCWFPADAVRCDGQYTRSNPFIQLERQDLSALEESLGVGKTRNAYTGLRPWGLHVEDTQRPAGMPKVHTIGAYAVWKMDWPMDAPDAYLVAANTSLRRNGDPKRGGTMLVLVQGEIDSFIADASKLLEVQEKPGRFTLADYGDFCRRYCK